MSWFEICFSPLPSHWLAVASNYSRYLPTIAKLSHTQSRPFSKGCIVSCRCQFSSVSRLRSNADASHFYSKLEDFSLVTKQKTYCTYCDDMLENYRLIPKLKVVRKNIGVPLQEKVWKFHFALSNGKGRYPRLRGVIRGLEFLSWYRIANLMQHSFSWMQLDSHWYSRRQRNTYFWLVTPRRITQNFWKKLSYLI